MDVILLYAGSAVIFLWGLAHIFPTRSVVDGFGPISEDNKRIITMEWVAEGLTLSFIGLIVFLVTLLGGTENLASTTVYLASAAMLIVLAVLSSLTGARTSIVPMKICPIIKAAVALAFFTASVI